MYGLLGLADSETKEAITVNYDKPVEILFSEVAIHLIRTTQNLNSLYRLQTIAPSILPFCDPSLHSGPITRAITTTQTPARTRASNSSLGLSEDLSELRIHAIYLDRVHQLTEVVHDFTGEPVDIFLRIRRIFEDVALSESSVSNSCEPWSFQNNQWKYFWRTLFMDRYKAIENPRTLSSPAPNQYGEILAKLFVLERDDLAKELARHPLLMEGVVSPTGRRRIFLGSQGTIGLVPSCTKETDVIVTVQGSSKPIVLRRNGENYSLVGEAYFHSYEKLGLRKGARPHNCYDRVQDYILQFPGAG